jgi:cell division protein FtsI (penicillin-binding protein 3)/stage V sporulation protein D (sporulation-specific penicillin-binding protein)
MKTRTLIISIAAIAAYVFLLFRISELQLSKSGYYTARAASEQSASAAAAMGRGSIFFTNADGTTLPVAVEQYFPTIYAVPTTVKDAAEAANELAPILNVPAATLQTMLSKPNDNYELLIAKAPSSTAAAVEALNLPGIYVDQEPFRYYPLGTVAAQVVGFVGPNATTTGVSGHYGIEGYYNNQLASGQNIVLTIDPNIQIESEKILQGLVSANDATAGSVIVEDPATGKILAMGAYPTFDPNDYASSSLTDFMNPNIQSVYEPGSIFKLLTMAAGINSGKLTSSTTYDDKGYVNVDGAHITNYNLTTHGPYGPGTTMTEVIQHSINTGAIFAENTMGNDIFKAHMLKFRINQKTGIDLPGEIAGTMNILKPNPVQVDYDTVAYGQGVTVTPIELITAIGMLANHGVMMRPYINAAAQPKAIGQLVSASTAEEVTQMGVAAVDLADVASINGYSLAGKTGSAFIPNFLTGGYTTQLVDSYIGYGPTTDPKFIALIRLSGVPETSLAAETVVPAWRELAQYIINYYNIPPDRPLQKDFYNLP